MNDLMNLDIWNKTLDVLSGLAILVPVSFIAYGAYQGFKTPLIYKNIRKNHGLELIIDPNSSADIPDDIKLTNITDALNHEKKCALEVKIPYLSSTPKGFNDSKGYVGHCKDGSDIVSFEFPKINCDNLASFEIGGYLLYRASKKGGNVPIIITGRYNDSEKKFIIDSVKPTGGYRFAALA